MSNSEASAQPIKWLGGRTYLVTEVQDLPYKFRVESEDGSFKAHIEADDPMAEEIELALENT
jgi:hypothetical protein